MRAIDLFAGAGGFTVGAAAAGIDVVWAANHWQLAVDTHERNHPETQHKCQDLRQADWSRLPEFELLLASPACQGHSTGGQPGRKHSANARRKHDQDRATAFAVVDCADTCEPTHLVVENVPQFRSWRLYDGWRAMLERIGYRLEEHLINAADIGVPQDRTRLFIIGALGDAPMPRLERPTIEHRAIATVLEGDAGGWAPVATKTAKIKERVGNGRRNYGRTFLTQHVTGHPGRSLERPIGTITTAGSHWHLVDGDRMRALTPRELARASGFPEGYLLPKAKSHATKMVGNAVCPPVAEWIAERILVAA